MEEPGSKNAPVHITEDEAAVYDRQIRLWGLEAQQRMRNATILVAHLRGTATEVIKNIVLAGIGKLVIVDGEDVSEEDLGAGFFFRDEDIGKKRVDAAKARIESLNPLVVVETVPSFAAFDGEGLDELVQSVDLVCATDWTKHGLIRVNDACRRLGKLFYCGGTFGMLGYIFADLLKHEFIAPDRAATKDAPKTIKTFIDYCPLDVALQYKWTSLSKRQAKVLNPAVVFTVLAVLEYQSAHRDMLQVPLDRATEMERIANTLLKEAEVNKQTITVVPRDFIETMSTTAEHEFSPVCAVVGGMLAQDILKALAAREAPITNFFTFDGNMGGATVCALGVVPP